MTTSSQQKRSLTILQLGAASFVAAHLAFLLLPNFFESWNARTIDQLFLLRSAWERLRPPYDNTIVHVDLSDTTLEQLDNYYVADSRRHYAQVIRNLTEMHVAAQFYDYIFIGEKNDAEDRELIAATASAGNVYFGLAFDLRHKKPLYRQGPKNTERASYVERTVWHVKVEGDTRAFDMGANPQITFPALASAARGLGYLNMRLDRDGVYRRVPLLMRYNGAFYPSLSMRLICDYLGVPPERILVKPGKHIILQDARRPGAAAGHDIVIPIDRAGNMVVNYIGPWERMVHYNFADIFLASDDRDELAMWREDLVHKIVVISEVATGSSDVGPVPTDANFPLSGVHANVMHTILTENFLRELSFREMLIVEVLLLGAVMFFSQRFSSLLFPLSTNALAVGYLGIATIGFLYGHIIFNIIRPLLMMFLAVGTIAAYRYINEAKQREVLRKTFEAYFPPLVVEKIMANPDTIPSAGQKKELTIMFTDIKSFTTYSSTMTPHHIQSLLNEYFEAMIDIVFKYEGTVDKFIGDGLMVFFGDPEPQPDHALRCVRAAIDMQYMVHELRVKWEKQGDMPIQIRIGINTGEVVVGNMGSAQRLSYTVLGSNVNLAQRLEVNAPVGGILISQRTYDLVKGHVTARSLGKIQVKGLETFIDVYEVPVSEQSKSDA